MMATDPRRRKSRHLLTPENLSTCIQVSNIPNDWTSDTVTSVIAGSGRIIDIKVKNDPRSGKLTYINYDYVSSRECDDAYELLNRIDKFPCKIEKTIPPNYKERLEDIKQGVIKPGLELNRDSYPWSYSLELPFQMVTAIPIPRRPLSTNTSSNNPPSGVDKNINIAFPDILSKASQHLPSFKENMITVGDNNDGDSISKNLSKIPPLQLIEMLSNLKILANQGISKKDQLSQFLQTNDNLIIAISQSLLEMGFFTEEVVTSVIKSSNLGNISSGPSQSYGNATSPSSSSSSSVPYNNTNSDNLNSLSPPPASTTNVTQQNVNYQPPPQSRTPPIVPTAVPVAAPAKSINYTKLQTLPTNQQEMIKQVLTLTDDQLSQLPADQQTMVHNLRRDYLI